jgi:hypothetical protein
VVSVGERGAAGRGGFRQVSVLPIGKALPVEKLPVGRELPETGLLVDRGLAKG